MTRRRTKRDEEHKAALAGPHKPIRFLYILKTLPLKRAPLPLPFVCTADWTTINTLTRLIVLHEIKDGITNLRTHHGLSPFDDGLLGERDSFFCIVRQRAQPTPTTSLSSSRTAPSARSGGPMHASDFVVDRKTGAVGICPKCHKDTIRIEFKAATYA